MKYLAISFLGHLIIALFLFNTKHANFYSAGAGSNAQGSQVIYEFNIANSTPAAPASENLIDESENTKQKIEKETSAREEISKEKKEDILNIVDKKKSEPTKTDKTKKNTEPHKKNNDNKKQKSSSENKRGNTNVSKIKDENKKIEDKGSQEGSGTKGSNSKGSGNSQGNGKGWGNSQANGAGDRAKEESAISNAIGEIQTTIMQHWFPPEEFAARKDIIVDIELYLDDSGNILSYKLLNPENTHEYKSVASSVLRVLNDPRVVPLPMPKLKNRSFKNVVLHFCPRDVM